MYFIGAMLGILLAQFIINELISSIENRGLKKNLLEISSWILESDLLKEMKERKPMFIKLNIKQCTNNIKEK